MKLINLITTEYVREVVNSRDCARLLPVIFDRTLDAVEIYKRHLVMSYRQTPMGPAQVAYSFEEEHVSIIRNGVTL